MKRFMYVEAAAASTVSTGELLKCTMWYRATLHCLHRLLDLEDDLVGVGGLANVISWFNPSQQFQGNNNKDNTDKRLLLKLTCWLMYYVSQLAQCSYVVLCSLGSKPISADNFASTRIMKLGSKGKVPKSTHVKCAFLAGP